jgi:hypothetical protein
MRTRRNRSAFAMTDTELKVIAALAIIGLKSKPKNGYSTPAATGTLRFKCFPSKIACATSRSSLVERRVTPFDTCGVFLRVG